jgi:hypothetical protein
LNPTVTNLYIPLKMALELETFPADSPMSDFLDVRLAYLTRKQYIIKLKMFFDSLGLKGSLDEQSREFLAKLKKDGGKEWAQNGLKYFIRDKKRRADKGELAESTIRNFYKPVKLFCTTHDVELSWKKITNTIPEGHKFANDRAPTHEEIGKVIEYPDRRIKPLVLVTCSSGIRIGAWKYLKWKHIEPMKRDDRIVAAKIIVYGGENEQYFTFMTPEAFQALQEWMDFRKESGENITGESWLMIALWDTDAPAPTPQKMEIDGLMAFVQRALRVQGLRKKLDMKIIRRHEFKTNHGFRKFFQTNAEPKMKSLDVMTLMGQDTGLAASYNKPTVEMLLGEYLKAVDNLTIDKTLIKQHQQDERIVGLAKNQQDLTLEMRAKDQEIQNLNEQMSHMKQDFESYSNQVNELLGKVDVVMKTKEESIDFLSNELDKYRDQFGSRALTDREHGKLREMKAAIDALPDDD